MKPLVTISASFLGKDFGLLGDIHLKTISFLLKLCCVDGVLLLAEERNLLLLSNKTPTLLSELLFCSGSDGCIIRFTSSDTLEPTERENNYSKQRSSVQLVINNHKLQGQEEPTIGHNYQVNYSHMKTVIVTTECYIHQRCFS